MFKDYLKLAWENIAHRRLRSLLTIIGIVIGIMTVVALVSLGQGVRQVIISEFSKIGTDKIFVNPGGGWGEDVNGLRPLTEDDTSVIERTKGVSEAAGMIYKIARIEYNRELFFTSMYGIPLDEDLNLIEETWNFEYIEGRGLKSGDKYKVIVGYEVAYGKAFGRNVGLGDNIKIQNVEFDVVGILKSTGDPDSDNSITIPKDIAAELFFDEGDVVEESFIVARTDAGEDPEKIAEEIERSLRRYRNVDEGEEDFNVQTTSQILESFDVILGALSGIIIGIAAISLFVGGVGIMNTMYTAVLQRTSEIGVMKAIGAKNSQVLTIFLIESGVIGLIGGAIGLLLGMGLSAGIAWIGRTFLNTILLYAYFPWYLLVGALLFAFVVGALSGILPAIQASRQKPVEALRYE
ncbi:MAG TPA: ABC transporter permease [Alphaproteobacteria bacterium]|nr:ABC transporter permease [Alphaproteobacteria bacterium]